MLIYYICVVYFAETCNLILQILAFFSQMIAKKCIFWLTTDHGWVTLVHGEYTFGNWWLLRLVCSTIWFACSCYLTVRVISFLCYFSQGYLPLHIPKLEERGRKARRFVLNQVQVNQRNLWDGSRWLKQWCYQERKFCFLWKTWGILYNWAVNCIELCMALLYLKLHGLVFVVLTTIMNFRYWISLHVSCYFLRLLSTLSFIELFRLFCRLIHHWL